MSGNVPALPHMYSQHGALLATGANLTFLYRCKSSPLYILLLISPFFESLKLNYLQQFQSVVTSGWLWWRQNWHQSSQAACGTSSASSCNHSGTPNEHRKHCVCNTVLLYMEQSTCHGHTTAHNTLILRQDGSYCDATLHINHLKPKTYFMLHQL